MDKKRQMSLTHYNTCFLRNLYVLFLGCYATVSRHFVYILLALILIILAIAWSFQCNFFMVPSNNKIKLPANNENLEGAL